MPEVNLTIAQNVFSFLKPYSKGGRILPGSTSLLKIEINPVWKVAYETGDWKDAWTEPDGRAEIQGKYFAMWLLNLNEGVWYLNAAIFTPERCIGESKYCRPRESSVRR